MAKLFDLKEWLTVADAGRHLAIVFGEEVCEADVLHLALDGRLRLSVNFVNHATARCGKIIQIDEAEYKEVPSLNGEQRVRLYGGPTLHSEGRESHVVKLEESVSVLAGVYDLPMIGGERLDIEHKYQHQTGGPAGTLQTLDGAFVETRDGLLCQLREEGKDYPAARLPDDAVLVVRTDALREFEQSINGRPRQTDRDHVSDMLATLNQAAAKFWGNADRNDRSTHVLNATIEAWLIKKGFSRTLAEKAATIIRPKWAPAGRKPEE